MVNFSEIKGQEHAKRALEVALAGGHSIILSGVKGMGKTMLLDAAQAVGVYAYKPSTKGGVGIPGIWARELEMTEAPIPIAFENLFTACHRVSLDAIKMIGTPVCPCGYFGDSHRLCTCTASEIKDYYRRLYTLSTEFDMYIELARVEFEKLASERFLESSDDIGERVHKAVEIQRIRYDTGEPKKIKLNGFIPQSEILPYCELDTAGRSLLKAAVNQLGMSGRMYYSALRVARTIADMNGSENISAVHLAEAIQYRFTNKMPPQAEPLASELQGIVGVLEDIKKQLQVTNKLLDHSIDNKN